MKILLLWNDWSQSEKRKLSNGYGGCGYYRTIKKAELLSPEHEVTVWGNEWDKEVKQHANIENFYDTVFSKYDVVWTHTITNEIMFAWMRTAATKHGTKLIMDIDDNFLDVHEKNPASKQFANGKSKKAFLATALSFCDAVTVSTLPLKEVLSERLKMIHGVSVPIYVFPNFNDIKDWDYKPVDKNPWVTIGYMGSISHAEDLEMVLPSIKAVMEKYPTVMFQLMGQLTHKEAQKTFKKWSQDLRNRLYMVQPTLNFSEFPFWLAQQPWDIAIAPLIDSSFNKCKSHIKWMEYSMYKIPTVASRVYPYYKDILGKNTIIDGETGLLANDNEWVDKLSLLIEDSKLREKLGNNAYNYIAKEWQYKDAKALALEITDKISK